MLVYQHRSNGGRVRPQSEFFRLRYPHGPLVARRQVSTSTRQRQPSLRSFVTAVWGRLGRSSLSRSSIRALIAAARGRREKRP
jgi:hypothetical protein